MHYITFMILFTYTDEDYLKMKWCDNSSIMVDTSMHLPVVG